VIRERYALLRAYFGRRTAYAYWLRSRQKIGRELGKQILKRFGLLKYWRMFKIAKGLGSRAPGPTSDPEPGLYALQAEAAPSERAD
jgi:hypothetical protein